MIVWGIDKFSKLTHRLEKSMGGHTRLNLLIDNQFNLTHRHSRTRYPILVDHPTPGPV